ncbi:hypothetical protein Anapl_07004 [Anas platyrhynchos]|uniref:Uncharacterized protein n=1 Tax=Anas platyrhynchos TaxID=8839 RepID=R0KEN8_ANAPL|nr:hypothetical protein Anapl_07004 [Anas platyrhynchos]
MEHLNMFGNVVFLSKQKDLTLLDLSYLTPGTSTLIPYDTCYDYNKIIKTLKRFNVFPSFKQGASKQEECKEQEEEHCSGSQIHLAQCLISSNHQQKMSMETSIQVTQSDTALVHASSPAICDSEASRAKEIPCPAPLLQSHLSHSIRNLSQRFHLVLHCNASLPDTVLRVFTSRPAGFRARPFPQALQKTVAAEDRHRCEDHSEIPEVVTGLGSPHTAIPGKPVWINQRKVPGAVSVPLSTGDAGISHTPPRKEGKH